MLNKILIYVIIFLSGTTAFFFGVSKYREYKLDASEVEVKRLETKAKTIEIEHDVKGIENNQSITFKIKKEVKIDEIPSSIGTHTINFRD